MLTRGQGNFFFGFSQISFKSRTNFPERDNKLQATRLWGAGTKKLGLAFPREVQKMPSVQAKSICPYSVFGLAYSTQAVTRDPGHAHGSTALTWAAGHL